MNGLDAGIIAVGSELLTPAKIDTNSLWLTDQLNALGVEVVQKCVVGDDRGRLTETIRLYLAQVPVVFVTGGLGPTEDDVTRDAAAAAVGRSLSFNQDVCDVISARFARMGRRMAENNKRQAFVIDGAEVLPNDRGTAPGQWLTDDDRALVLLPGPPGEMKALFERQCLPRLQQLVPQSVICTRYYRVSCMGESDVDQLIAPVYTQYTNPATTILAGAGDIHIHLRARCVTTQEGETLLCEVGSKIEALLGESMYTRTGESLEATIGELLRSKSATLAVAESVTGGLIGERITSVPGSSEWFRGGFLTYTDEMKTALLGVDPELLRTESAVSEPVARAMALGARHRTGSDYALAVTGYAGPDGGDDRNPVGTIFVAVAAPDGTLVRRYQFAGDRSRTRTLAAVWALDLVRRKLIRTADVS